MDWELIWWVVWGVVGVLFLLALPLIKGRLEADEGNRFYGKGNNNVDDMEDRW